MIYALEYKGHNYYGPWFESIDPAHTGSVTRARTSSRRPSPRWSALERSYETDGKALGLTRPSRGGTFIKIGVGVLRKPDDSKYDHPKTYEIVDGGKWTISKSRDSITFTHQLADPASQYGYTTGKPCG